jgi:hypothetical protein
LPAAAISACADERRQGSFADTDRVVIVSWEDDVERSRVTGHLGLRRLLRAAGLEAAGIGSTLDQLESGKPVVLVEVSEIGPRDAQARLDEVAEVA